MSTYNVTVQEPTEERSLLSANHYNLQLAKAVSTGNGPPIYNMVFASSSLAPTMSITWGVTYGMNWTANIPAAGATVQYGGDWQECVAGASYDITTDGGWIVNNTNANKKDTALNVGKNGYPQAVHIMIGVKSTVKDKDGKYKWQPVSERSK